MSRIDKNVFIECNNNIQSRIFGGVHAHILCYPQSILMPDVDPRVATHVKHLNFVIESYITWNAISYNCSTHKSLNFNWAISRENVSSGIFDQVRFKPACSA